jgi:hypothetical protein
LVLDINKGSYLVQHCNGFPGDDQKMDRGLKHRSRNINYVKLTKIKSIIEKSDGGAEVKTVGRALLLEMAAIAAGEL